jgi:hypothetical protein
VRFSPSSQSYALTIKYGGESQHAKITYSRSQDKYWFTDKLKFESIQVRLCGFFQSSIRFPRLLTRDAMQRLTMYGMMDAMQHLAIHGMIGAMTHPSLLVCPPGC